MRLIKSHGLGNDYLVLESGEPLDPGLVRALCDRHRGIGSDGILEPVPSARADWGLRIWNPDGSQAEKSGNGLRIFARWLVDHRDAERVHTVELPSGVVRCEVEAQGPLVTVQMGRVSFEAAAVPVLRQMIDAPFAIGQDRWRITAVGIGNPHCVVFLDDELDGRPWRRWGRALEVSDLFPNRTNVQFVRVLGRHRVQARIWERGAGETLASGSSACAVAAAAVRLGLCEGAIDVEMPGGSLYVEVGADWSVELRGPVAEVARVEVSPGVLSQARGERVEGGAAHDDALVRPAVDS